MNKPIKLDEEEQEILDAFEAGRVTSVGEKKIAELLSMHVRTCKKLAELEFPHSSDLAQAARFE